VTDLSECDRLDQRRRAILASARALFVEQGYEKTTLGEIVERAGGSLATVYKLFGNKDGLLEAVIFEGAQSGEALIREASALGGGPAAILHRLAVSLDAHFLDPEVVALVRIVIARSINNRDFARLFFERTATSTRTAIEDLFESWHRSGVAMNGTPAALAELFLGLFVSDVHAEAISHSIGLARSPERLRARTDFFIQGAGLGG
jgi:AcrR family transcriptional regulator